MPQEVVHKRTAMTTRFILCSHPTEEQTEFRKKMFMHFLTTTKHTNETEVTVRSTDGQPITQTHHLTIWMEN